MSLAKEAARPANTALWNEARRVSKDSGESPEDYYRRKGGRFEGEKDASARSLSKSAALRFRHHSRLDGKQYRQFTALEREAGGHRANKGDNIGDRRERHHRRAVVHNGDVVGFITPRKKSGTWSPGRVYVGREHRRKGYGPMVLQHFGNKRNVESTVHEDNSDLRRAYELAGYKRGRKTRFEDGTRGYTYSRSKE